MRKDLYCRLVVTTRYRLVLSAGRLIEKVAIGKFTIRADRGDGVTTVISYMPTRRIGMRHYGYYGYCFSQRKTVSVSDRAHHRTVVPVLFGVPCPLVLHDSVPSGSRRASP